jgi:hypothetical protein
LRSVAHGDGIPCRDGELVDGELGELGSMRRLYASCTDAQRHGHIFKCSVP